MKYLLYYYYYFYNTKKYIIKGWKLIEYNSLKGTIAHWKPSTFIFESYFIKFYKINNYKGFVYIKLLFFYNFTFNLSVYY